MAEGMRAATLREAAAKTLILHLSVPPPQHTLINVLQSLEQAGFDPADVRTAIDELAALGLVSLEMRERGHSPFVVLAEGMTPASYDEARVRGSGR
jgi:hypothetical protein